MIRLLIGLPGDGKTRYAVEMIVRELVYSERKVITNIEEIKLKELTVYIEKRYPEAKIDLDQRLKIIPKASTMEFYRHRAGDLLLPPAPALAPDGKRLAREIFLEQMIPYFSPVAQSPETSCPVSYFLDEAHEYFPAAEWADIGRPVLYYASKHRHLHDEVYLITQAPGQIAATLRRLVAETYKVENWYRMSFGPFRRRGCFRVYAFYGCADHATDKGAAYETSRFQLDEKGLASVYATTGALGVLGREEGKSIARRRVLLPYWSLWAAGAFALVGIIAAVQALPRMVERLLLGPVVRTASAVTGAAVKGSMQAVGVEPAKQLPAPAGPAPAGPAPSGQPRPAAAMPGYAAPVMLPRVVGVVRRGGSISVTLEDGSIWTEGMGELEQVDRAGAIISGRRHYYARKPRTEAAKEKETEREQVQPVRGESVAQSPKRAAGSWVLDDDGVQRLREPERIGQSTYSPGR